jgi:hypothetical protein
MARKFDGSWGKRGLGGAGTLGSMALAIGLAGLPAQVAAQTQLIQNGNFSIVPTADTATYQVTNNTAASPSQATAGTLPYWSTGTNTSGINCLEVNNPLSTTMCGSTYMNGSNVATFWVYPGVSPNGGNSLAADSAATYANAISQSVSGLTVGQTYNLTFYQAGAQQNGFSGTTTDQWQVTFGSSTQDSTLMHVASESDVAWNSQSMLFTASATTQTLTFMALGTPNSDPPFALLDGVSLISVPEPASIALLGFGIAGVAGLRRRRSRASARAEAGPPGAGPPGGVTG